MIMQSVLENAVLEILKKNMRTLSLLGIVLLYMIISSQTADTFQMKGIGSCKWIGVVLCTEWGQGQVSEDIIRSSG